MKWLGRVRNNVNNVRGEDHNGGMQQPASAAFISCPVQQHPQQPSTLADNGNNERTDVAVCTPTWRVIDRWNRRNGATLGRIFHDVDPRLVPEGAARHDDCNHGGSTTRTDRERWRHRVTRRERVSRSSRRPHGARARRARTSCPLARSIPARMTMRTVVSLVRVDGASFGVGRRSFVSKRHRRRQSFDRKHATSG